MTASAVRAFAQNIGVTKFPSLNEMALLEHAMRDEFNRTAERRLAVLHPLKIVLSNYPEGTTEELDAINNPEDPAPGMRKVPCGRARVVDAPRCPGTPVDGGGCTQPRRERHTRRAEGRNCSTLASRQTLRVGRRRLGRRAGRVLLRGR